MASGRFLAGGLKRDGIALETVFGLPIDADGSWVDDEFIGNFTSDRPEARHAIFRAGLAYDSALRPKRKDHRLAAANLFAAGSILGGYDPAKDGSGMGVAILTGYLAGEHVAQEVAKRVAA